MQAVPPDWVVRNQYNPQEQEDLNPDKRLAAMSADGALKREDEREYYDGAADNDDKDSDNPHKGNRRQYLTQQQKGGESSGAGESKSTAEEAAEVGSSSMDVE